VVAQILSRLSVATIPPETDDTNIEAIEVENTNLHEIDADEIDANDSVISLSLREQK